MRLRIITYGVILLAEILWCGGIIVAPLLSTEESSVRNAGHALYQFYHPICHQRSDRSLFLAGHPLGVCGRCTSIYFAFLAGTLLFPFVRSLLQSSLPSRWFLILFALPMLVDATWIGTWLYDVTIMTRVMSGALFGFVLPFFLLPAALQAVHELIATVHPQKGLSNA